LLNLNPESEDLAELTPEIRESSPRCIDNMFPCVKKSERFGVSPTNFSHPEIGGKPGFRLSFQ